MRVPDFGLARLVVTERVTEDRIVSPCPCILVDATLEPRVTAAYPEVLLYDGVDAFSPLRKRLMLKSVGASEQRRFHPPIVFQRGIYVDGLSGENRLLYSQDLTEWTVSGTPVVTAKTAEDDSAATYEGIGQTIAASDATGHVWTFWVKQDGIVPATRFPQFTCTVGGSSFVKLDTSSGATVVSTNIGGSHTVVTDIIDGVVCWKVAISFITDDGNGIGLNINPAVGANANLTSASKAAVGEITIMRQQLRLTSTPGIYRKTVASQRLEEGSVVLRYICR